MSFSSHLGHRIGRGKGYYDNYLSKYEGTWGVTPYTIALAFRTQIVASVPCTPADKTLNEVICASEE